MWFFPFLRVELPDLYTPSGCYWILDTDSLAEWRVTCAPRVLHMASRTMPFTTHSAKMQGLQSRKCFNTWHFLQQATQSMPTRTQHEWGGCGPAGRVWAGSSKEQKELSWGVGAEASEECSFWPNSPKSLFSHLFRAPIYLQPMCPFRDIQPNCRVTTLTIHVW